LTGWGWVPLEPQDPETPLGQVPKDYIVFLRSGPEFWTQDTQTNLAYANVGLRNYYSWLQALDEAGDAKANTKAPQSKPAATEPKGQSKPAGAIADWQPLFNDDNLAGWEGLMKHWTLQNRDLVGTNKPGGPDGFKTFLCSKKKYKDFEIRFQVRVRGVDNKGDGGLNFRSAIVDEKRFTVSGPQGNMGKDLWGDLLSETGVDRFSSKPSHSVTRAPREIKAKVKQDGFNDYYIKCVGKHVTIKLNGETTVDGDFEWIPDEGILAWQIFDATTEVVYRDIQIRDLSPDKPSPNKN
jgi:hypothetical protein